MCFRWNFYVFAIIQCVRIYKILSLFGLIPSVAQDGQRRARALINNIVAGEIHRKKKESAMGQAFKVVDYVSRSFN